MHRWMANSLTKTQAELMKSIAYRTARGMQLNPIGCYYSPAQQTAKSLWDRGLIRWDGSSTSDGIAVADVLIGKPS